MMSRSIRLVALFFVLLRVGLQVEPAAAQEAGRRPGPVRACDCTCESRGGWTVAETGSFSVWSHMSRDETMRLARRCEALRGELQRTWLGPGEAAPWQPRCAVVVHPRIDDYRRALGGARDVSVGCTTITCDEDRVVFRRIDLRSDADGWEANALPHELTHVVLADRFAGRRLPSWLDEGLAMSSESAALRARRAAVLTDAVQSQRLPALETLLGSDRALSRHDAELHYSISLSLVEHLERQGGHDKLLAFAENLLASGCSAALQATYGIEGGIGEWERRWLASLDQMNSRSLVVR